MNYTDGTYGSPIDINLTAGQTWSNFTWDNDTFASGVVAWKIYANDSSGFENVTGGMTFSVVNVSFEVTLPNGSTTYSSISGTSTLDEDINATTSDDKNVTVCIRGTSDCQNSTIIGDLTNVSNFRINNTGSVNENITMCINESLPSSIVLFGTKTADPYDASLYVIPNCSDGVWIANSSLPVNAVDEFWIWANFTGVSVNDATQRKLYINSTESGT